jgi:predicted Zn-dependent peptidase
MRSPLRRLPLAAALALALAVPALAQEAAHPRELKFPELDFEPPAAKEFRLELDNGLVAYLVPDDSLPSVRVRAYVRTGSIFDPAEKEGLCGLAFATLRAGGAGKLDPDDLDAKLDALAASIDTDSSDARATVDAWTPATNTAEVMRIFADVLRRPKFESDRVERTRDDTATEAKNDEDDSGILATRRIRAQLYGDHPYARFRDADSIGKLGRKDLVAFHKKNVTPGRVVLAISGKFDKEGMAALVTKLFGGWKAAGSGWPQVPAVAADAEGGGILVVDHPDMSAAYIEMAHLGVAAGSSDEAALVLTDHIWGSGSFTSRVVEKVRTEEALAYTCGSDFDTPPLVPGLVRTYMQCAAPEASYALKLSLDEARRLAEEGPTADELAAAKAAVIARFPSRFTTSNDRARALAEAELDGLPADYFAKYRARIAAVTGDDVKAAAARYYRGSGLSIVVIGPIGSVRKSVVRGTSLDDLGNVRTE